MPIKLTCPHCGEPTRFSEPFPFPGKAFGCGACKAVLKVQYPPGIVDTLKNRGKIFEPSEAPLPASPRASKPTSKQAVPDTRREQRPETTQRNRQEETRSRPQTGLPVQAAPPPPPQPAAPQAPNTPRISQGRTLHSGNAPCLCYRQTLPRIAPSKPSTPTHVPEVAQPGSGYAPPGKA